MCTQGVCAGCVCRVCVQGVCPGFKHSTLSYIGHSAVGHVLETGGHRGELAEALKTEGVSRGGSGVRDTMGGEDLD